MFKDKRTAIGISVLIGFIILTAVGLRSLSIVQRDVTRLKEQRKEMMVLRDDLLMLSRKVQAVETKKSLSNVQGITEAVEEVFSPIGLKDKLKAVKSTGKRETRDGFEEEADITLEKVSMNEMVNIFYRIEHVPMVLTIKNVAIKKSFENPELLNVSLILSFLKKK
jgi:general secretion pathway protein M